MNLRQNVIVFYKKINTVTVAMTKKMAIARLSENAAELNMQPILTGLRQEFGLVRSGASQFAA